MLTNLHLLKIIAENSNYKDAAQKDELKAVLLTKYYFRLAKIIDSEYDTNVEDRLTNQFKGKTHIDDFFKKMQRIFEDLPEEAIKNQEKLVEKTFKYIFDEHIAKLKEAGVISQEELDRSFEEFAQRFKSEQKARKISEEKEVEDKLKILAE